MKLTIYRFPEEKDQLIWTIDIKDNIAEMWYEEVWRRFWEIKTNPNIAIYDIDESFETWQMSIWHLEEMMKFLKIHLNK